MDERGIIGGIAFAMFITAFCVSSLWSLIFYVGLIRMGSYLYSCVMLLKKYYIQKQLNLIDRYGKGSYALVTGGANGIGLEYAKQFADLGFNLVLLDMDEQGLANTKQHISSLYKDIKIETIK